MEKRKSGGSKGEEKKNKEIYITLRPSGIIYACAMCTGPKEIPFNKYSQIGWKRSMQMGGNKREIIIICINSKIRKGKMAEINMIRIVCFSYCFSKFKRFLN